MSDSEDARSYIDGRLVAEIIMDFQREFKDVYPYDLMVCEMMAVGPMQTLLGNAIKKGLLPPHQKDNTNDQQDRG